jgi:hypothetical protein
MAAIQLSIRLDLETGGRIGPGRIAQLEAIRKTGSIIFLGKKIRGWSDRNRAPRTRDGLVGAPGGRMSQA